MATTPGRSDNPADHVTWHWFTIDSLLATSTGDNARLIDQSVWDRFLARLADAGRYVSGDNQPNTPVDRASGFHHLLKMLRFGIDWTIGGADPYHPHFGAPWPNAFFDFGAGCPDAIYRSTRIRGDATYRVHGRFGNARYFMFDAYGGDKSKYPTVEDGKGGGSAAASTLSVLDTDIKSGADGAFEFFIGPEERPGNWFQLAPDVLGIFTREFFYDWDDVQPATFEIECLDPPDQQWHQMDGDWVANELAGVAEWLYESTTFFVERMRNECPDPNVFGAPKGSQFKKFDHTNHFGRFDLGPDECLVVEMRPPEARYWSIHTLDHWFSALDYANFHTSLNAQQATIDDDGVLRVVVSADDPGVPNWLDTRGNQHGLLCLRLILTESHPIPTTKVVARGDVRSVLPANTPTVDPSARRQQIERRRRQVYQRLYPPAPIPRVTP